MHMWCVTFVTDSLSLMSQVTGLKFHGNRIVSGSDDSTLKVWHATTGKVSEAHMAVSGRWGKFSELSI